MRAIDNHETPGPWRLILWVLRATVAMQCLGNWYWLTQYEETPLLHWLLNPVDVGGLNWPESTALMVQQVVGWAVLFAGAVVLWRPFAVVLAPLVCLQLVVTIAMWQLAEGYALQLDWAPLEWLMLFPFGTQIARIAAPLGLLLMCRGNGDQQVTESKEIRLAMQVFRFAIAIVFIAHGIEACQLNPKFLDLLMLSIYQVFGLSMTQATAERCLLAIGVLDILLAFVCLGARWLPVMGWLAFWGGATAVSRIVAMGWGTWHEAAIRFPHLGLPVAVALWWYLLKYSVSKHRVPQDQDVATSAQAAGTKINHETSTVGEKHGTVTT